MNVFLFLLVSLIVHSLPVPYRPGMLRFRALIRWLPLRLIWGTGAWAAITIFMMLTLPWAIIGLVMSFGLMILMTAGLGRGNIEDIIRGAQVPIACMGLIIVITIPAFTGLITWTSDVSNATFFDEMIEETDEPLFTEPIPDNMVRLVTKDYAIYVARQHIGPFGSNVQVAASHITTKDDRLVWVCTITSTNVLAENFIKGFIVVDANDPQSVDPLLINGSTIPVGEGLFWDKNIRFANYLNDMGAAYQYAYPTWDPAGNMVYVQTRTPLGYDFVERAIGPVVYAENGSVYEYDTIGDTPSWITQAYAEEYLERQVARWGGYRRGDGFDLFAGGLLWLIPPSNDRLEISEDTRYIVSPDTGNVEAFLAVHPVTNSRSLAGVFRATQNKVYYHDLSGGSFISGTAAADNVVAGIPQPASGFYFGSMPLLYPVRINSSYSKWTWYTPIYWAEGSYDEDDEWSILNMRLHALALVDASNVDRYARINAGGSLTGAALVEQVRNEYVTLFGGVTEEEENGFEITATVVNKSQYVQDGDTHIVLGTDNSTIPYIEGTRSWMRLEDWYTLLNLQVGDIFTATVQVFEGQYRITAIDKS